MKTHKKRKIIIITIAVILAVLIGSSAVYLCTYYHTDASAEESLSLLLDDKKAEEADDGTLIFYPDAANDLNTGFIFYPGGKVEYTAYAPLMEKLAERGITCFLLKMPFNLAVFDTDAAENVRNSHPEIGRWYIGGHSLGGVCASMDCEGNADEYEGLVLLGAYANKDLSKSGLKVISIYGSNDGVMNRENYEADKANLPVGFTELVIEGGCHSYFGCYGNQSGDGEASVSREEQQNRTADAVLELINES